MPTHQRLIGSVTYKQASLLRTLQSSPTPLCAQDLGSSKGSHHLQSLKALQRKGLICNIPHASSSAPHYAITPLGLQELILLEHASATPLHTLQGGSHASHSLFSSRALFSTK